MKGRREAWLIDSPSIARLSWSRGRQDLVHIVDLRGLALHHEKILAATDPIANQLRKVSSRSKVPSKFRTEVLTL